MAARTHQGRDLAKYSQLLLEGSEWSAPVRVVDKGKTVAWLINRRRAGAKSVPIHTTKLHLAIRRRSVRRIMPDGRLSSRRRSPYPIRPRARRA